MPTHYETLGVPRSASMAEIKQAYRKKALENHPDKTANREHLFKAASEAYETLGDEGKRAAYDLELDSQFATRLREPFGNSANNNYPRGGAGGDASKSTMNRAEREAFRREEKDLLNRIFEQDREFMARARQDRETTREDLEHWMKTQARELSGENSIENQRRREMRQQEMDRDRAEQVARRKRLQEIEDELHRQKEEQRQRQQREDSERHSREAHFDKLKRDIRSRMEAEAQRFQRQQTDLEAKWADVYTKERVRSDAEIRTELNAFQSVRRRHSEPVI